MIQLECNRSAPPGSAGVPPAKIAAKMAALPGKGRGGLNGYTGIGMK